MGHQRSSSWEFKLQMIQLLEKGEHNPSQISQDHHETRSLLYVWWQLYREQREAAFMPTQAFPASARS
jgi:transposase-like protein